MNSHLRTFASHTPDAAALKPGRVDLGPSALGVARFSSHAIFAGALEVEIEHNGVLYRLRQTSLGKLILTK
jgi:hemin uptake protein HemP